MFAKLCEAEPKRRKIPSLVTWYDDENRKKTTYDAQDWFLRRDARKRWCLYRGDVLERTYSRSTCPPITQVDELISGKKFCIGDCQEFKDLDQFYFRRGRKNPRCKKCVDAMGKQYAAANPDKIKSYDRKKALKAFYGITLDDYDEMLARQRGMCALCPATSYTRDRGRLAVDHDHRTGKVRGLLCYQCNSVVGYLEG